MKKISFPQDGLKHNFIVEWWYFNGHLKDLKGNRYAFMDCLFKVDVKKVKIPFISKIPHRYHYFSHSILSDIKRRKYYPIIDYYSAITKDSFTKPLMNVHYTNPFFIDRYFNSIIEETEKFTYHLRTEQFDLQLQSLKKPLLLNGNGYVNLKSKKTYYYSLTNLETSGIIKLKNKEIKVKGTSWMDHQWANVPYSLDSWTWFSLQLTNNTEIVCFEFDDGKKKTYLASISYADDKQESTKGVYIKPTGSTWTSKKTKATYELGWRIAIPSKDINLHVKPMIPKQEMIFGTINYWEGPLHVEGTMNGRKVKGNGFMELVGRPSRYKKAAFIKDVLKNTTSHTYEMLKNLYSHK